MTSNDRKNGDEKKRTKDVPFSHFMFREIHTFCVDGISVAPNEETRHVQES